MIICHTEEILPGRYITRYEWQGKPDEPVFISRRILEGILQKRLERWDDYPERLDCFPWPMRLLSAQEGFARDAGLYVRSDTPLWLWHVARFKASRFWQWFFVRAVYTAMVWGLAYVPEYEVPSWQHLGKKRS